MAGPFPPISATPDTSGNAFPNINTGDGNSRTIEGLGIAASIASDVHWYLTFIMPPTIPSGQAKLVIWSVANATSGTIVFQPQWTMISPDEDYDNATLNDEGQTTTTWGTGDDNDQFNETKINLDAEALSGGDMLFMDLIFDSTSTLAQVSTHLVFIIWE